MYATAAVAFRYLEGILVHRRAPIARHGRVALGIAALTTAALTLIASPAAAARTPAQTSHGDLPKPAAASGLDAHDTDLLTKAQGRGEAKVTMIVATDPGTTAAVAARLTALGARIAKQVDQVGYLRASVPTGAATRAAKISGVHAVDLDESIPLPDIRPDTTPNGANTTAPAPRAAATTANVAAPGPTTGAANPYLPTGDTGAVTFKQQHPTWDGRGVTIGILDSGIDLDHPAFQTTSTGARKIRDWITVTDPVADSDGTWRPMAAQVTGTAATWAGTMWTLPAGQYRINEFTESITMNGDPHGDVNRDGDTTDTFGILYDPVSHDVRVDVRQNHDFTDDAVLRPYRERFDVGHFGTDDPQTTVRDQIPFVVEYREDVDTTALGQPGTVDFVNIGIVESAHGTHVAGITAGNNLLDNPVLDGAAPGATLVSARACNWDSTCTAAALTDGLVELVVNRKVDVVNISIGGLPWLNDGNNARAELYNRLIQDYKVQLFISAGNEGPGTNTVGDPSVAADAVSVAASVTRETWLANYGSTVRTAESVFPFSSRGPREDGGLKPTIAAPGSAISTTPLWQPGSSTAETGYQLPPGYSMYNGTSMAAPQATGAAALLLSAAKATGRTAEPAALRRAITSSATWIDGVSALAQGTGKFNVPGAWQLLARGVRVWDYRSDAPVCTALSEYLATPGRGQGIYNNCPAGQGGQRAGEVRTYNVTITRTRGPERGLRHTLRWLGNDGTFSAPHDVVLPRDTPVTIPVRANPTTGTHSAVLRVDDPATVAVDFTVLNTVTVAQAPAAPTYAVTGSGTVDRNATTSVFVTVPPGAAALQVDLSGIAADSQTRWIAFNPYGFPTESNVTLLCYTNYVLAALCNPTLRTYPNPVPGVWELEVESRRTSPTLANPFVLTARVQGVALAPAVVALPSVTAGVPTQLAWQLHNTFGPVTATALAGPLGSVASSSRTIAQDEHQTSTVVVPAGTSRVEVSIGNTNDPNADLDLYVFLDATMVGRSAGIDAAESVSIANPVAGTYRVMVVGYTIGTGTTTFDYRDGIYAPGYGAITVPATAMSLEPGTTTTLTGSVVATSAPETGRTLAGALDIITSAGTVLGRALVQIGAVN